MVSPTSGSRTIQIRLRLDEDLDARLDRCALRLAGADASPGLLKKVRQTIAYQAITDGLKHLEEALPNAGTKRVTAAAKAPTRGPDIQPTTKPVPAHTPSGLQDLTGLWDADDDFLDPK